MWVLLQGSTLARYGQEYRARLATKRLGLVPVTAESEPGGAPRDASLVITFNPDDEWEKAQISRLPPDVPVVAHYQLQPAILDAERRRRTAAVLKRACAVIVPARFLEQTASEVFGLSNIRFVQNGVDESLFRVSTRQEREAFRTARRVPNHALLCGYVGQLTPAKGFELLKYLGDHLPDGIWLLIHTRPTRVSRERAKRLRRSVSGRVLIEFDSGDRSRRDHPTPFLDLLLSPSLSEVAPLIVTEALVSGIPSVTTRSTPFFSESAFNGIGEGDLTVIDLPGYVVGKSSEKLQLQDQDLLDVGRNLLKAFRFAYPPSEEERMDRRRRGLALGFGCGGMIAGFREVYEQCQALRS